MTKSGIETRVMSFLTSITAVPCISNSFIVLTSSFIFSPIDLRYKICIILFTFNDHNISSLSNNVNNIQLINIKFIDANNDDEAQNRNHLSESVYVLIESYSDCTY